MTTPQDLITAEYARKQRQALAALLQCSEEDIIDVVPVVFQVTTRIPSDSASYSRYRVEISS